MEQKDGNFKFKINHQLIGLPRENEIFSKFDYVIEEEFEYDRSLKMITIYRRKEYGEIKVENLENRDTQSEKIEKEIEFKIEIKEINSFASF